jgi:hypothetical protein
VERYLRDTAAEPVIYRDVSPESVARAVTGDPAAAAPLLHAYTLNIVAPGTDTDVLRARLAAAHARESADLARRMRGGR